MGLCGVTWSVCVSRIIDDDDSDCGDDDNV